MTRALRRSVLFLPASNARMIEKARGLDCDVVALDLEDAVAPEHKNKARENACAALAEFKPREVVVRINGRDTPWHDADLAALTQARPDAIVVPKVRNADDIEIVAAKTGDLPLWAMIESPAAVVNLGEIAPNVAALVLGANDLLKEMGARHRADRANLAYVMSAMVLIARAHGITALDSVHNAIADEAGLALACIQARDFGFDGKTLIHPSQIRVCHDAFMPSPTEIAAAQKVLAAFAATPDKGALSVDGKMVERLDAEIAARTLAMADRGKP